MKENSWTGDNMPSRKGRVVLVTGALKQNQQGDSPPALESIGGAYQGGFSHLTDHESGIDFV
jgi:hypothetical protein